MSKTKDRKGGRLCDDDGENDDDESGMRYFAEELLFNGVTCLPIPKFSTRDRILRARARIDDEISLFPEFKEEYVRNGALATPGEDVGREDIEEGNAAVKAVPDGLQSMTVKELQAVLSSRHLPTSGSKSVLLARIQGQEAPRSGHRAATVKEHHPNKRPLVKGGFSVLGNPSSFHNDFVRDTRKVLHSSVKELMQALVTLPDFIAKRRDAPRLKFCQEIDRMMIRPIGVVPTSESWHRDSSPRSLGKSSNEEGADLVFGGWLNLDLSPQTFSCVLGSHMKEWDGVTSIGDADGVGFKPITDPALRSALKAQSVDVVVLPGELLIFADGIVHEVHAKPRPSVSERLFTGWRLTHSDTYLLDQPIRGSKQPYRKVFEKMMAAGAPITVKSDQEPTMYRPFHRNKWFRQLEDFSLAAFPKEILTLTPIRRTRDDAGNDVEPFTEKRWYVPVVMPSLEALGLRDTYAPYAPAELGLYKPQPLFPKRVGKLVKHGSF
jgi:hypothetical protein